jgi:hypothetical protein
MINQTAYVRGFVLMFILFGLVAGCALVLASFTAPDVEQVPTEAVLPTPTELVGCTFIVEENTSGYTIPFSDPILESTAIRSGNVYAVMERRTDYLLINISGNYNVWIDRDTGILNGFCTNIPHNNTPIQDFPLACILTLTADADLYVNPALAGAGDPVTTGEIFVVTRQNDTAYYVGSEDGRVGWISQSAGDISGACGAIPR